MSSPIDLKDKVCEYCGKQFVKGNGYQDHLNIHRNLRPHICEICGKTFNNTGAKSNHKRIHDSDRHFHCPLCKRSFPWKVSLKVHLKSHQRMGELTERIDNYLNDGNTPRQIRRTRSSKAQNSSVKSREFREQNKERRLEEMYFNQQQYEERVLPLEALVDENKKWYNDIANLNYTSSTMTLDSSNTKNEMTINGTWAYSTENENKNDDYKNAFLTKDKKKTDLGSVLGEAIKCYYDIPSAKACYEPKLNIQYLGMKNYFSGEKSDPVVVKKEM